MNTRQVNAALKRSALFRGTFPRDKLPSYTRPFAIIVNTDSGVERGEHWVAIYVPKRGHCEYFDPMGWPPPHRDILRYLNKQTKMFIYSCEPVQGAQSNKCGHFCIAFIKARQKGVTFQNFINSFGWDYNINDKKVSSCSSIA